MKIFYTVSFFLVSLISWSQPVDSHMPKDTSMLSAYVRQGAFLYSEASLVSDYIKQFKIDETVVALSFKKGGFDYIYVLDRDKKLGYVPLMDLTITDRTLDVLKRRNDTNQEERVSFAKKQVSTFLAKYIKAEQRVVRLSKFEEDNGISVTDWSFTKPDNVAGSVNIGFLVRNPTKKVIKYVWFTMAAYNAVEDRVGNSNSVRNDPVVLKAVGPVGSGMNTGWVFKNVWYNQTIECVRILKIKIQYIDQSFKTVNTPFLALEKAQAKMCND